MNILIIVETLFLLRYYKIRFYYFLHVFPYFILKCFKLTIANNGYNIGINGIICNFIRIIGN